MKATLYIKATCPFCVRAIEDLKDLNYELEIHDVTSDNDLRDKISQSVGGFPTVPMIFVEDEFIGGYSDLKSYLEKNS